MERRIIEKNIFFRIFYYYARFIAPRVRTIAVSIYENDDGSIAGNTSARLFEEKLFRYELNVILTN